MYSQNLFLWLVKDNESALDYFGSTIISLSSRWKSEFNPFVTYVNMFDVLRQREFKGQFLELGGGYSTVLLNVMFDHDHG